MTKIFNILISIILLMISSGCSNSQDQTFTNGDIIFHTSLSSQSKFIQDATNSKFSHVGIIYIKKGKPYVFEAVEPVRLIPLSKWINKGENKNYTVYRSNTTLSENQLTKMYEYCVKQEGKNYDMKFQWDDSKIYCSELVWYTYNSIGIQLSTPKTFSDFEIESPEIKKEIVRRYGDKFVQSEPVVSPQCLIESKYLFEIFSNY
tara:strand:- start:124 stop:735 length:612 start_codon:yes stop_codon:yes gene_type:complete